MAGGTDGPQLPTKRWVTLAIHPRPDLLSPRGLAGEEVLEAVEPTDVAATLIRRERFRWDLLLRAFALNLVYLAIGIALFRVAIAYARKRGMLLQMGE